MNKSRLTCTVEPVEGNKWAVCVIEDFSYTDGGSRIVMTKRYFDDLAKCDHFIDRIMSDHRSAVRYKMGV